MGFLTLLQYFSPASSAETAEAVCVYVCVYVSDVRVVVAVFNGEVH